MTTQAQNPLRIAVVGCGVAGLTAAWLLSRRHDVHLFERNDYPGGHTRTLTVPDGPDAGTPVDTGFIVMNHRNYPLFSRVLEELGVAVEDSSMTFSFFDRESGYGYSGNSFATFLSHPASFTRPAHWSLLRDLRRFAKVGYRDLCSGFLKGRTLGEYCAERCFGSAFLNHYLYPMGAAIWSSPVLRMRDFPAHPYLHFLENHGLLRLVNRPQWKFVRGGSRTYVEAMLKSFRHPPRLAAAPVGIRRHPAGVTLRTRAGDPVEFDHVVIGAHADEALALLDDPDEEERALLGAWRYQNNEVVLHTATANLPPHRRLWSSWNFVRAPGQAEDRPVSVSYHMNRLQRLRTRRDYVVTLNPVEPIPPDEVIDRTSLTHPLYSFAALESQEGIARRNGARRTWFCGSYLGYGFHEDAVRSAVAVAHGLGVEW